MTKSILAALVLVGFSIGIMWVWFSGQPVSDPVNIGAQNEQAQSITEDSNGPSRLSGRDKAATSLGVNVNRHSQATSTSVSPVSAGSAPKLTQLARDGRPASASPDDERAAGLAIAGLVQDEEGYPIANI